MSSSESRNPGPQTVQPLFGCVGTEPEYFRLPLKMEPAMFLPHSREQILEAMASSLSNPGWLDGFPSTHRVPHKRQWCVTANHRSWLLAADPNICLWGPLAVCRADLLTTWPHQSACWRVVDARPRLLVNRSTGEHVRRTSGSNTGRGLLLTNTSETSRCTSLCCIILLLQEARKWKASICVGVNTECRWRLTSPSIICAQKRSTCPSGARVRVFLTDGNVYFAA